MVFIEWSLLYLFVERKSLKYFNVLHSSELIKMFVLIRS